jgi:hypothetical protein
MTINANYVEHVVDFILNDTKKALCVYLRINKLFSKEKAKNFVKYFDQMQEDLEEKLFDEISIRLCNNQKYFGSFREIYSKPEKDNVYLSLIKNFPTIFQSETFAKFIKNYDIKTGGDVYRSTVDIVHGHKYVKRVVVNNNHIYEKQ